MANELADAQLALRRLGSTSLFGARHDAAFFVVIARSLAALAFEFMGR
jgi:hypothetical protein